MTHEYKEDLQKLITQPMKMKELLEDWYDHHPQQASRAVHFAVHGKHLNEDMMNEALCLITRYDGVKAPFWTMDEFNDLIAKTNISLAGQAYSGYDVNYLAQAYLADFKSLGQEPVRFVCMAIDRLHDVDDPKASEAAFYDAEHRIRRHH